VSAELMVDEVGGVGLGGWGVRVGLGFIRITEQADLLDLLLLLFLSQLL
jgi:hypothetical protein